jgi:preprotein translocase subunit SecE
MSKFINYARDSYKELAEKVTWPTWPQLQQSTMIVIVATIVITLIVLAMDFVFGKGLTFIYDILN